MAYSAMQSYARRMGAGATANAGASREAYATFDPTAAAERTAGSLFSGLSERFAKRGAQRRSSLNSRGLFNSDLGGARESKDFNDQLADALAGLSMQTEGMRMNQLSTLYGGDREDSRHYEGMATDLEMSERAQQAADKSSKRGMWGSVLGAIGGAAGTALLGPLGGAAGSWLTRKLGG